MPSHAAASSCPPSVDANKDAAPTCGAAVSPAGKDTAVAYTPSAQLPNAATHPNEYARYKRYIAKASAKGGGSSLVAGA